MSVFTLADAPRGKELDESELMRWVAEAPLFPTALLPSSYLHWEAVNSSSSKALVDSAGISIELLFHFSDKGEIIQVDGDKYRSNR